MKEKEAKKKKRTHSFCLSSQFFFSLRLFSCFLSRYAERPRLVALFFFSLHARSLMTSAQFGGTLRSTTRERRESVLAPHLFAHRVCSFQPPTLSIATREEEQAAIGLSAPFLSSGRSSEALCSFDLVSIERSALVDTKSELRNCGRKHPSHSTAAACPIELFLIPFFHSHAFFSLPPFPPLHSSLFRYLQQSSFTMAALPEVKLFGKWSYEDVEVRWNDER